MTSIVLREIRIKITINHHYTPIIMAQNKVKQQTHPTVLSTGDPIEKLGLLYLGDWNETLYSYFGKECVESKIYTYTTQNHLREVKIIFTCMLMFIANLFIIAKKEKDPNVCHLVNVQINCHKSIQGNAIPQLKGINDSFNSVDDLSDVLSERRQDSRENYEDDGIVLDLDHGVSYIKE